MRRLDGAVRSGRTLGDGDAAPSPLATGLPARAPAGRPPLALVGPPVIERHQDAEEFPRERATRREEEEATRLAVRPRGAPRERSQEGRHSASCESGQRSAATTIGGRCRRGCHHHDVDYPRGDESPSWVAGALIVRPRGARLQCPEGGGASEAGAAGQRSPATAHGGRGRLRPHHDAVEWGRESEPPSRESGALIVRARGAPQERPLPEGGWTSHPSAAGQRSPAPAHLGRHRGGLVSPREREPRRAEGRPRGLQPQYRPCDEPSILPEGSLGDPGKFSGFEANGVVGDNHVPQDRPGVGATASGKGRDKSKELPARLTPGQSTPLPDAIDARSGLKNSTAAVVHDEFSTKIAPSGDRIHSLSSTKAGEGGSGYKPESSGAAALGHAIPAHGVASIASVQAAREENVQESEMVQSIITELLESKRILDVEFVESWLKEKERVSTLSYFQKNAPSAECIWYNKWASCLPEYSSHTSDLPCQNAFKNCYCDEIPALDLEEMLHKIQYQKYKCDMHDLLKGSSAAMQSLMEFLCRSCLDHGPKLELVALRMILATTACNSNLHILGAKIRIIGIVVIKTLIGSPNVQNQALKLLCKLCGQHENTKRILEFGGFACALHVLQFSAIGADSAAHLVSILLESEYSYPSIFKDRLAYHMVKSVGLGRIKESDTIEDILFLASNVELALSYFLDALRILKSGSRSRNLLLGMLCKVASAHTEQY